MIQVTNATCICRHVHTPHVLMCVHLYAQVLSALPQSFQSPPGDSSPKSPTFSPSPSCTLGSHGPETPESSKRLHTQRGRAAMTRLPGSCGEFLQRLLPQRGSSLLKVQAAVVSPHLHRGKIKFTKIFTKSCLSVDQQAFTDSCSFHTGLGTEQGKRERNKHRPCPTKGHGHKGAREGVGWRFGGTKVVESGPGRGSCMHKILW